jgi:hypothetical protein
MLLPEKENKIKFKLKGNLDFKELVTPRKEYKDYYMNQLKKSNIDNINNEIFTNENNIKWKR